MMDSKEIKQTVKEIYSRSIKQGGGCQCTAGPSVGEGMALIGYDSKEISVLPENAIGQSYGCGNPNAFLHVKEGDVVLDLGSGAGFDAIIAAGKVGPSGTVIGVDMTDAMLDAARENARRAGLSNVEFRKGDIENLPVDSDSVDHIISNCVISLAPDKEKVYREAHRVLKKGGDLVVSDIVTNGFPEQLRNNLSLWAACAAGALEEEDYLGVIRKSGFREVMVLDRIYFTKGQLLALAVEGNLGSLLANMEDEESGKAVLDYLEALEDDHPITVAYSIKISAVKK